MNEQAEIARLNAIIVKQQELINLLMGGDTSTVVNISPSIGPLPGSVAREWNEDEFRKFLVNKALSQNTVDNYVYGMRLFFKKHEELNEDTVRQYNEMLIENFKPKTVNLRLSGLDQYFEFAGVAYSVKRIKEEKHYCTDRVINDEQYKQLANYTRKHLPRTYVICAVLAHTGMRVSEFCSIKKEEFLRGEAHVVSKANRARPIYFTKELIEDVSSLLSNNVECLVANSHTGEPVTSRTVTAMLKHAARMAGVDPAVVYPHSFRHYFAKKFLEKTNDLTLLADILGHGSVNTTAIYTRKSKSEQIDLLNDVVKW